MLPEKLAFVDIETTGMRASFDRIIEIGILRVENNTLTKTFTSLINPQTHLPPEITSLTNIHESDLVGAPTFRQIKDEILETIHDCIFVAHNARFDYSFIRHEFKRLGITFRSKHFCTVRLSHLLFPQYRHHNLDAVMERFGIPCQKRHRAYDDANVLYEFYTRLQTTIEEPTLLAAVNKALRRPTIPLNLSLSDLEQLPELPGVYIFYGDDGAPLYIGKSINIKDRVLSHFSGDIHSPLEMKISQQIKSLEAIPTSGELGALLLESQLIKKHLPLYNRRLRLKKQLIGLFAAKNKDGYLTLSLNPLEKIMPDDLYANSKPTGYLGFFRSKKQAKEYLVTLAQKHMLCEKMLGLEKTSSSCFGYRLERCKGACIKKEQPLFFNLRLQTAVAGMTVRPWPYPCPILIKETSPYTGMSEYFLIDKWCMVGKIKEDEEENRDFLEEKREFDVDTYKILKQFILQPKNSEKIKLFSATHALSYPEQVQLTF